MFTTRLVDPLTSTDKLQSQNRGATFAAAFQYTEQSSSSAPRRDLGPQDSKPFDNAGADLSSPERRKFLRAAGMNGYTATPDLPPPLYVRALYDYDADDQTSLSFRKGDVIQVLTQLESGWWDGVINDVRGWFPSNYCAIMSGPDDTGELGSHSHDGSDTSADSGAEEDEFEENDDDLDSDGNHRDEDSDLPIEGTGARDQEEAAAFWIPQATPDGRLYYYNTLTNVTKMELPLETPTSTNETGPLDRTNFFVPDQTRPPHEMMARDVENDEEEYDGSASENEAVSLMLSSRGSVSERKGSTVSNTLSTAASTDSMSYAAPSRNNLGNIPHATGGTVHSQGPNGVSSTSFAANPAAPMTSSRVARYFVDDGTAAPVTWSVLVENMRQSIELYRKAVNAQERAEFVRRAEDISDHLRMLLAAGSGTTDNHSGNPSIISTNKALYPHFRDMMSRFSKLVLSSHIAAADWPGPDALAKCLQEADGVLHGVYGYVEVARQQRGEELPRLVPGFVSASKSGGHWRNNNLLNSRGGLNATSFMDQEDSETAAAAAASFATLDGGMLHSIDDKRKPLVASIRRLEEQLQLNDKLISPSKQLLLGDMICGAAGKVIDAFKPWIRLIESVNLAPQGSTFPNPQLLDFSSQKQKAYDSVADLVASCQAVTAPLADEWAEYRGPSLEDRLNTIRGVSRGFDSTVSQISYLLQLLSDTPSLGGSSQATKDHRMTDGDVYEKAHLRVDAPYDASRRPQLGDIGQSHSYTMGTGPPQEKYRRTASTDKPTQFFGQMPPADVSQGAPLVGAPPEGTPWFLQLDHLAEVTYETKFDPPQLKSGTLRGLVEQLTRHDRLDASFNGTFLLTYRSFTTAADLFELLVRRFNIQPPPGLSPEEYPTWEERKQKLVRFRVVNILKNWFESYWMEENNDASQKLLERAFAFAKNTIANTKTPGSAPLMTAIDMRLKGHDTSAKRLVLTLSNLAPPPILPKNMKKLKFLDIDAKEFARQLTIIESRLYGKIKSTECLDKTWQRKVKADAPDPAPNVKSVILHSNQLTNWVAEMILQQSEVKKRVIVIKHFVTIADVRAFPYVFDPLEPC
jgi:son of sevenless-like protein